MSESKKNSLDFLNREMLVCDNPNPNCYYDVNKDNVLKNSKTTRLSENKNVCKTFDTDSKLHYLNYSECIDNTKRKNLDTSVYTDTPLKIQGRGFGNIDNYHLLLNGIGISTRQENPDSNPRNVEDKRILLINQTNYVGEQRITNNLPCGADTRYLNKKMI